MGEEALDLTQWRTRFSSGYGTFVRQSTQWIHESVSLIPAKKPLFLFTVVTIQFCCASLLSGGPLSVVCIAIG